jgi:hypothetical protein
VRAQVWGLIFGIVLLFWGAFMVDLGVELVRAMWQARLLSVAVGITLLVCGAVTIGRALAGDDQ